MYLNEKPNFKCSSTDFRCCYKPRLYVWWIKNVLSHLPKHLCFRWREKVHSVDSVQNKKEKTLKRNQACLMCSISVLWAKKVGVKSHKIRWRDEIVPGNL